MADAGSSILQRLLLAALWIYRAAISPLLGPACRYAPSCSAYAQEALRRHGPFTGAVLAAKRVSRCHPWSPGGYDPVPERGR